MGKLRLKTLTTSERLALASEVLSDKKAEDIVILDLRELNYTLCDYFMIATAESDRQAQAIVDSLIEKLKEAEGGRMGYSVEGYEVGQWILLDLGDIVLHVLSPEARAYYKLEELWGDAKVVTHV
ncbi:MAG: ribosome silencing factor [Bacteroidia bacterium]|nr:ribosome silencing factor [Bacteroidia bacterium]MCX7764834.1 ribosome silencing factor [Bacteroidia bacterium]MDW8057914.1 ribosome silencing factor [Bacteroidia bacterium]